MAPASSRHLGEYRRKRDFSKTAEPTGEEKPRKKGSARGSGKDLEFVVQKHAATHLHYDLRLELDGVMKSWAVPKGPSLDPAVKRLAMEVEDHPIAYNTFEGTIPKGEYGGGTVMLWDRGTYTADGQPSDPAEALRRGFAKGDLKFQLNGERLRGSFVLVRLRKRDGDSDSGKPQWLLIKHRDEFAQPGGDVTEDETTSVDTGRTMDEIAEGKGKSRVWHSNRSRSGEPLVERKREVVASPQMNISFEPMLASVGSAIPKESGWTFEPKFDGIRVLALVSKPEAGEPSAVALMSRNARDKAPQFPEIVAALRALAFKRKRAFVIDGEIVALDGDTPIRFEALQSRMHETRVETISDYAKNSPAAFIAFDLLLDDNDVLLREPWSERRQRLEVALGDRASARLRLAESVLDDGKEMLKRAREGGWEGVIAKRLNSTYQPGVRSREWLKLKIEHRQEFVVGGYTEPRNTREHIGALLVGYYDGEGFVYAGHVGGGFTRDGLKDMARRLKPLARSSPPFTEMPKSNEPAHWVRPEVVVEVKFIEWTADGKLRQPVYLGVRDDKAPHEIRMERESVQKKNKGSSAFPGATSGRKSAKAVSGPGPGGKRVGTPKVANSEGVISTGKGETLRVTSLDKIFFPADGYTKGDLLTYYARMAPFILPAMKDRPLVLKRFPNGITGQSFYQQNAPPPDDAPPGVRIETLVQGDEEERRIIGGDLTTLLWTIQLGAISYDPWHSRIRSLEFADYTVLDLDPGPKAPFERVVDVARWVKAELDALGLHAALKTSGSEGIHIYVPLSPKTPNEAAMLTAQIIATRVAEQHPAEATVERSVKARPSAAVYVDYLQNILGKTVAGVYAVRARDGATVSTPLEWAELTPKLDPRSFDIHTMPQRMEKKGDIWASAMKNRNSLTALRAAAKPRSRKR
ncbi:MAG: DNA ligase D [Gemmatimonadaceae bacterium]